MHDDFNPSTTPDHNSENSQLILGIRVDKGMILETWNHLSSKQKELKEDSNYRYSSKRVTRPKMGSPSSSSSGML